MVVGPENGFKSIPNKPKAFYAIELNEIGLNLIVWRFLVNETKQNILAAKSKGDNDIISQEVNKKKYVPEVLKRTIVHLCKKNR